MKRGYKKAALALASVGATGFLVLLALELILRLTGAQPDFFFQLDPEVGAIHIPGQKGWHVFAGGRQYVEINSHGYRDLERSLEKESGTIRIAILGDSFVEAFQVPLEATFTRVLERRFNAECGSAVRSFEVLNFGVSGFGTGQELATLRRRVLPFEPDLVLLYFYPSNDLFDNSREIDPEPNRLHFRLDDRGGLVPLPYEVSDNAVKRWLRQHSKAYLFLRDRIKRLAALRRALVALRLMQRSAEPSDGAGAVHGLRNNRYLLPPPPEIEGAWRLTEALIVEARRIAEQASASFGLVVIPNREEILHAGPPPGIAPESWNVQQSLDRTRDICYRQGLECLPLVRVFRDSGRPFEESYIPRDDHWTAHGHATVAAATFEWLGARVCAGE